MDVVVVFGLLGLVGVLRTVVAVRSGVSDESLVEVGDVVILLALIVVVAVRSVRHADSVVSQSGVGVFGGVADKVVVILILLVGGQESW